MPLHVQTINNDSEDAAASGKATAGATAEGGADSDAMVIELNFNAFADNVPPTRHAKRVHSSTDPSLQDFADQALEISALRAELKRLTRDYDALQHGVQLRDQRLQRSQEELMLARSKCRDSVRPLSEPSAHLALVKEDAAHGNTVADPTEAPLKPNARQISPADELSSTLKLAVLRSEPPATVPESLQETQQSKAPPTPERQLIPVGHDGEVVVLHRDIITVGRTRANDICIPSAAVSRDHARLLMSPRSVTVVDMDSANGCFVNDEPVKRQQLREGDVLRIGDRSYRFAIRTSPVQPNRATPK